MRLKGIWVATAMCLSLLGGPAAAAAPDAVWLDAIGRPSASAHDALRMLADAPAEGLEAQDYGARELALQAAALTGNPEATTASAQAFAHALDAAMQRFLNDLHRGRVDPRSLGFRIEGPVGKNFDVAALLHAAAAERRLPQAAAGLRPRLGQYDKLREALARYRKLAAEPSPGPLPPIAPAKSLKPGAAYAAGTAALHQRLVAMGDLPPNAAPPGEIYDAALADGVRRFQARHGLDADGALGSATLAALNVPFAQRTLQLELALERLRWLPEFESQSYIGINIPMFRLWAWNSGAPTDSPIEMNVVVGRALNTQTPVLSETLRYVIFRPYWNVPPSITRNEILPAIARDPGYLQRSDMEIVRGGGDDAQPVVPSAENLALLRQGVLRVRQRPGPKNSLGRVKFIFPNNDNVYLHDTPATQLFGRAKRDLSHGCVRVEGPAALAEWVLRDQPGWTRERIEAAMAGPSPQRVDLTRPLQVILFYMTAMVGPSDGSLRFAQDIYGHDARLAQALARPDRHR